MMNCIAIGMLVYILPYFLSLIPVTLGSTHLFTLLQLTITVRIKCYFLYKLYKYYKTKSLSLILKIVVIV